MCRLFSRIAMFAYVRSTKPSTDSLSNGWLSSLPESASCSMASRYAVPLVVMLSLD
jgi:hypothetical protein